MVTMLRRIYRPNTLHDAIRNYTKVRAFSNGSSANIRILSQPTIHHITNQETAKIDNSLAFSAAGTSHDWCIEDDLLYFPDFISNSEHAHLTKALEPILARRKWEEGHWDSVINQYREISKSMWEKEESREIIGRILTHPIFSTKKHKFHPVHVLDLNHDGEIRHHVDNDYAGDYVVGLTLLSPRIMEFKQTDGSGLLQLLVEPRSLYCMRRRMRHNWTHAILGGSDVVWDNAVSIPSERRISLLFRDMPEVAAEKLAKHKL